VTNKKERIMTNLDPKKNTASVISHKRHFSEKTSTQKIYLGCFSSNQAWEAETT